MKFTAPLICLAVVIASCGGKSTDKKSSSPTEKSSASGLNKEGTQAGHVVKVTKVEDYVPADGTKVPEGMKLVAIQVEYYNPSADRPMDVDPFEWTGWTNEDNGHAHSEAVRQKEPALKDGSVAPGARLSGWVTFQIPTNTTLARVEYDNDLTEEKALEFDVE